MDSAKTFKQRYFVVFTKTDLTHWIFRFIHRDFQHCFVVKEDLGLWLVLDARWNFTKVSSALISDFPTVRDMYPQAVAIVPVECVIDTRRGKQCLGIGSCVDVVKGALGITDFWIWTPYQLFRKLREF